MTLFIYEHLTSGVLSGEPYSAGLMHEGDAMLQAISKDLLDLGHHIVTMRDARLQPLIMHPNLDIIQADNYPHYQTIWQDAIDNYQQFLIIAPETDGILYELITELERHDKTVLGCDAQSIKLCSDKMATFQHLQQHGINTPETWFASDWIEQNPTNEKLEWMIKPIDGAGCENSYCFDTQTVNSQLPKLFAKANPKLIVQPFIKGTNLSLSLFITESEITLLSINAQYIENQQQQLRLSHCEPNRFDLLDPSQALNLAYSIHDTMPGLWGFVGVDLIKTEDKLWVIELNPRLTSSYAEKEMRQHHNPATPMHQQLINGNDN